MSTDQTQTLLAARGLTDDSDRLLTADEPIVDLHERCGGTVPGTLAVPEMLALVQQARKLGLRVAREFAAFDGEALITGFVRVHPLGEEDGGGCEIMVDNWQRSPLPQGNVNELAERLDAIDRASAEISARLDSQQRVQVLSTSSADATELEAAIAQEPGKPWSNYVELVGVAHHQPLHWRLLDGANCKIPGSDRGWRVRLLPSGPVNGAPRGFELLLVADEPMLHSDADLADAEAEQANARVVGSALTPVLRQPIARIIANAETIQSRLAGPLRAEYSEYAGNIASAGKHLSAMLDDLGDLEVVEAPDFKTAEEKVDLSDVARRAAGILGVRSQDRNISILLPPKDASAEVIGEFRRVLQILINLIGNAIAYSPVGSTVEVLVEPRLDQTVDLKVIDQGPGVDPEQASKVFDKFERLGRDNDGGSGLGLYISRRLARAMSGELSLNTDRDKGAEFILSLRQVD